MPNFIFIQQISVVNILNMLYNLHFFSSKCRLFHNATLFGFCITHILSTGVLKFEEKISVAKRLMATSIETTLVSTTGFLFFNHRNGFPQVLRRNSERSRVEAALIKASSSCLNSDPTAGAHIPLTLLLPFRECVRVAHWKKSSSPSPLSILNTAPIQLSGPANFTPKSTTTTPESS